MTPRVVLDTNVVIAGVRSPSGAAAAILRRIESKSFVVCLSPALMLEYEDVLRRPMWGLDADVVEDLLNIFLVVSDLVVPKFKLRPNLRDPGDDHVLELAVAAGANRIITFNVRDFRGAERFGILIERPSDFLDRLTSHVD